MQKFTIAILGATGAVGEELISVLQERAFPVNQLRLFASQRSAGQRITWYDQTLLVEDVETADLNGIQIAFFSAGSATSKTYVARFIQVGAVVIDNTSAFRMQEAVPLVVPEVNPDALNNHKGLIANPNCSTIQLMAPLKALHKVMDLKRIVVSTYQSASGAGRKAMEELRDQTVKVLRFEEPPVKCFPRRLAFDVIPLIGDLKEDGESTEEEKMLNESRKILELPNLQVSATCVRVPTFIGHCISVNVEGKQTFEMSEIWDSLSNAEEVIVCKGEEFPNADDVVGQDEVWVGRIRKDHSCENAINLWVAADNLRKGAASNAVQIAEVLVQRSLVRTMKLD
jgi:aspartate-semialdehyde dehydrogenase